MVVKLDRYKYYATGKDALILKEKRCSKNQPTGIKILELPMCTGKDCAGCEESKDPLKMKVKKRIKAFADIGSHGYVLMFQGGEIAEKYPTLLHIYHEQITPDLKPIIIEYEVEG